MPNDQRPPPSYEELERDLGLERMDFFSEMVRADSAPEAPGQEAPRA